jgi:hypothetical protein
MNAVGMQGNFHFDRRGGITPTAHAVKYREMATRDCRKNAGGGSGSVWPSAKVPFYGPRMPSLIESLIASAIERPDNVRIAVTKRPAPMRPRELFEVFGAMGVTASFGGVIRSLDFRMSRASTLANAILGRWLTNAELAALPQPYHAPTHLREMMASEEFRRPLIRRICEAFPEKRRLMHVRIPSCAGRYTAALLETAYPVLRQDYASKAFARVEPLAQHLGAILSRIDTARGVVFSAPHMGIFLAAPERTPAGDDYLGWTLDQSPCRAIDLLFATVRSPVSLALSQANGTIMRLRATPQAENLRAIARALGHLPPADAPAAAWKTVGQKLIAAHLPLNPICSALGDGTAEGAFAACARGPVEIVELERHSAWCRTTFTAPPYEPIGISEPTLRLSDLTQADHAAIKDRMGQDMIFYTRFRRVIEASDLPAADGHQLGTPTTA